MLTCSLMCRCSGSGSFNDTRCVNMTHRKIVSYRAFVDGKYGDAVNSHGPGHGTHVVGCVAGNVVSDSQWREVCGVIFACIMHDCFCHRIVLTL